MFERTRSEVTCNANIVCVEKRKRTTVFPVHKHHQTRLAVVNVSLSSNEMKLRIFQQHNAIIAATMNIHTREIILSEKAICTCLYPRDTKGVEWQGHRRPGDRLSHYNNNNRQNIAAATRNYDRTADMRVFSANSGNWISLEIHSNLASVDCTPWWTHTFHWNEQWQRCRLVQSFTDWLHGLVNCLFILWAAINDKTFRLGSLILDGYRQRATTFTCCLWSIGLEFCDTIGPRSANTFLMHTIHAKRT